MSNVQRTIMVVDDDADIADMTRVILEQSGYQVIPAASGAEALRKLRRAQPDLIILDINMPEMDGWQVLRLLKAEARTSRIPVAMFSIRGEVHDRLQGLQEGAFDYIVKPFSCDELVGRVRRIFDSLPVPRAAG
ncbi:MAG: PleD family two-component system response regulator [Acidobacteriota bacterium]